MDNVGIGIQGFKNWPVEGHTIIHIHNPKEILSGSGFTWLVDELVEIATLGFGKEPTNTRDHVLGPDDLFLVCDDIGVVGFAGFNTHEFEVHLEGIALLPDSQKNGLGRSVIASALDTVFSKCKYLTLYTQNPRMYATVLALCTQLYPSVTGDVCIPEEIREVAVRHVGSESFDLTRFVCPGRYAYPLYESRLYSRNSQVNDLFEEIFVYEDGVTTDAVLCVGALPR